VIGPVTVRSQTVVVPGGVAENSHFETRGVTSECSGNERAISGGTGWSDDNQGLALVTQRLTPVLDNSSRVIGFRGVGGNDSGQSSTFTVYALCYTPSS
jgi:hypothetical protein